MSHVRVSRADVSGSDPGAASGPGTNILGLDFREAESTVILVPVPWDATTSYRAGTARGWEVIRAASEQVDLYDLGLRKHGLPRPWEYGLHLTAPAPNLSRLNARARALAEPIIARGGAAGDSDLERALDEVNRHCTKVDEIVYNEVRARLAAGKIVGLIGGEHSVSFGTIKAHAETCPGLGVLQIDAHADLRSAYEGFARSHASIMHNVLTELPGVAALTQVAVRDLCDEEITRIDSEERVTTFFDAGLKERMFTGAGWAELCREIIATLPQHVYISFDIDGLDPALCPSTGTPVPGGLGFAEAVHLLEALVAAGKTVIGFDLTEVAPAADGDEWDGNVGARLLYKLCGVALVTNGARS